MRALGGMLAVLLAWCAPAQAGRFSDPIALAQKSGDVLQIGLPVAALGLTFLLQAPERAPDGTVHFDPYAGLDFDFGLNGSPRHDLALAFARAELATYTLKYAVDAQRPNGGGQSFPSGHTALAFTGAEFIRKTYGLGWGLPAYLMAGFVGWSRVASNNHYPRDVIAGAALGILSNHDLDEFELPVGRTGRLGAAFGPVAQPAALDAPLPLAFVEPGFTGTDGGDAIGLRLELRFR